MDLKLLEQTPSWDWPRNADNFLISFLDNNDADFSDRLLAAELAGEFSVISNNMADTLLSVVNNNAENKKLRAKAAISLGPVLEYADMMNFEDPDDIVISEPTFTKIQATLRKLYMDAIVPSSLRRQILEASVRAPQDWHQNAVRAAYYSGELEWKLTAVFCMRFIDGFDQQILESLNSNHPEIECQAVCAAGNWEVSAAWSHIVSLIASQKTDKYLLLAAIEAASTIRPLEAPSLLHRLLDSKDQDIIDSVHEAIQTAEAIGKTDGFETYGDEDFDEY
jgi:hypothetical protein